MAQPTDRDYGYVPTDPNHGRESGAQLIIVPTNTERTMRWPLCRGDSVSSSVFDRLRLSKDSQFYPRERRLNNGISHRGMAATEYSIKWLQRCVEDLQEHHGTSRGEPVITAMQPSTATASGCFESARQFTTRGMIRKVIHNDRKFVNPGDSALRYVKSFHCVDGSYWMDPTTSDAKYKPRRGKGKAAKTRGYLMSQVTVRIKQPNPADDRHLSTKAFLNMETQIPGLLTPDLGDSMEAMCVLEETVGFLLDEEDMNIRTIRSVIRNYKTTMWTNRERTPDNSSSNYPSADAAERVVLDLNRIANMLTCESRCDTYDRVHKWCADYAGHSETERDELYRTRYSQHYLRFDFDEAVTNLRELCLDTRRSEHPFGNSGVEMDTERDQCCMIRVGRGRRPRRNGEFDPPGGIATRFLMSGKVNLQGCATPEEAMEIGQMIKLWMTLYPVCRPVESGLPNVQLLKKLYPSYWAGKLEIGEISSRKPDGPRK